MQTLKIKRSYKANHPTIGEAELIDQKNCQLMGFVTLELPWLLNQNEVSCIPEGTYKAIKHISPTFGETLWIQSVHGRSEILIHVGNYMKNTRGCILPGSRKADIDGDGFMDVTSSGDTLKALLQLCEEEIQVEIYS